MAKSSVLVINGPNLEILGTREPEIYGDKTLDQINEDLRELAQQKSLDIDFFQSNIEGEIVDKINSSPNIDAIMINAAAYTHTSVAIMDSLKAYSGYIVEVHISNPYRREDFRHKSYISYVADTVISGAGCNGYKFALEAIYSCLARGIKSR